MPAGEPGHKMTGFFYVLVKRQVSMKFLLVVLLVHLVIDWFNGTMRKEKKVDELTDTNAAHPAEFLLR